MSQSLPTPGLLQADAGAAAQPWESEEKFRRIFNSSSMLLAFTRPSDGRLLEVNDAWVKALGIPREVACTGTGTELGLWGDPGDRSLILAELARKGAVQGFETTLKGRREPFPVRVSVQPVHLDEGIHLLWEIEDLTEHRRIQRLAADREARFTSIFEHSPCAMSLTGVEDGRILQTNEAWRQLFGWTREEVLGRSVLDLGLYQHPGDRQRLLMAFAPGGKATDFPFRARRRDGEVRHLRISVTRTEQDGSPCFLTVLLDHTELLAAEEQRLDLQAQLAQAQRLESLGSLAGGVAHDMNNVLGAILALASANLTLQPEGSLARTSFETIHQAALRGGEMVKGLLTFARKQPAKEAEVDLNAVLLENARLLEHTTLARVRLELDLASGLPPIRGDGHALANAFMNLCVNGVDAMPDNGILTLRTRKLEDGRVEVQVEDTGCGMPRSVLDRALDPYFTTKPEGKGTGLGLPMVYSTVKAHGGELVLRSEPGQGTRVSLRFPACLPATTAPLAENRPETGSTRLGVLLVDDDDLVRKASSLLLEVLGHRVTTAGSGEEALALLEGGLDAEVVILDLNMPGLGGGGTLPRLRSLRPGLPVLLATGRTDQAALDLVEANPGVTLLAKPFGLDELQASLAAL